MSRVYLPHIIDTVRTLSRRTVLKGLATLGIVPALAACNEGGRPPVGHSQPSETDTPLGSSGEVGASFEHGVASGDPDASSVVLWTRVTPDAAATIDVEWVVSEDAELTRIVDGGVFQTNADRDYTVKVVAENLQPWTHYWYQFRVGESVSVIGRTKTAPQAEMSLEQLRFAFASCAHYSMGHFNAYRGIANRDDLDLVVHLGDYIYEYGGTDPLAFPFVLTRYMEPDHEIVSLQDYRTRHAQYKTDADLQAAHAMHPWVCTWDDHETTNNSYTTGADNHTEGEEGLWVERKRVAIQAYFEWLPVREDYNPNTHPEKSLYRRLRYGDLAEFFVLDTRLEGRDPQAEDEAGAVDPSRNMMSPTQEQWLLDGLRSTPARWKILAQQTMLSQLYIAPGRVFGYDAWDGYVAQRNRLLDAFAGEEIDNVVVITGDIHTAFCNELTKDPTDSSVYTPGVSGSVGVEFVCPSITTQGFPPVVAEGLRLFNRHMMYAEGALETGHGYVVVTATPERCEGAWKYSLSVLTPIALERDGPSWGVNSGETTLSQS